MNNINLFSNLSILGSFEDISPIAVLIIETLFVLFYIAGIIMIIGGILTVIGMWITFEKANKPGWAALIPIYNLLIICEIVGFKWYYILLLYVPVINLLFIIVLNIKLAKSFGKSQLFGLGLNFLPFIFYLIIVFNKEITYKGTVVNGDLDFNDLF